ncbi:replication-associated protein [Sewage-associated gemycircularvirus 6]|uniref:Replication-associated protein n=2 Tax=Genomoviridae TaxID=1910928 RepID=A0A858NF21_9VIRU|nr:replication-associated protein [Sewage-associated gemycircularvirus 6]AIF34832.1 replication-associated protein [Sewage-associated gemycircularvirus 6]QJB18608.1 MAG: replication-associated protein [Genomoviridae sp.]
MSSFSFHARYALLTYAQCGDLCPFTIVDLLSTMGAECIIGREHHQDGGIHLHVFVDFGRKYRSRRADTFDVGGFHPNISQSYGTPEKGYDYACKDGDVVAGGLDRPVPTEGRGGDSKTHSIWSQITSATTRESFWDLVHDLDPKSAVTCFTQLQKYCDWKYRYCPPAYESPAGARFRNDTSDGRGDWLLQSGIGGARVGRVKSLVLYGPSQTGKTTWARSLGAHIYQVGLLSGSECMKAPDVEYAVFDDIRGGMKFFPSFKEWLGCQPHVCVKELYREPRVIEWGKPAIWCSNADPRDDMSYCDVQWMEANCTFIEITEKLLDWE